MTNRGKKLSHRRNLLAVQEREGTSLDGDLVADYFAQNIAERKFLTADECRDFIKLYSPFAE